MVVVKWIVIVVAVLVLAALGAGQLGWLAGAAPTDLGVHNGRLKPPALTPNSVSSQASLYPDHSQRAFAQISPLALQGDGPRTIAKLKAILQARGDVAVVKSEPDYLYVRYTSRWMRFVDDVEFWFDPAHQVIQVRSTSRIGQGDMGVNRARVESLRQTLQGTAPPP